MKAPDYQTIIDRIDHASSTEEKVKLLKECISLELAKQIRAIRIVDSVTHGKLIDPATIKYIRSDGHFSHIYFKDPAVKEYKTDMYLKHLEEKLIPFGFLRISRFYLVDLQYIDKPGIKGTTVIMMDEKEFDVTIDEAREVILNIG